MRKLSLFVAVLAVGIGILYGVNTKKNSSNNSSSVPDTLINSDIPLKRLFDSLGISPSNAHILIDKSDYLLTVKTNDQIIKQYRVVLGKNPVDDKRMEGDRCTPEGTFHMISKYPHAKWNKFIWFDYPNEDSRRKFKKSKENGEIPADATIGGEVGIHGTPVDCDYLIEDGINWTWGCVSLTRSDVDEIYDFITTKTDIVIQQ